MSLVFRRVKKISKRVRKSRSRTRKSYMDTSDYKPSLLAVDDEHFPSLNAVYKTDIFGTPIDFHARRGWDMCGSHKHKVSLNSITFMKEYCNKSFAELRWEDYQYNRKNSRYFQERSYLKCLSNTSYETKCEFELIQPTKNHEYLEPKPKCDPSTNDESFNVFSTKGRCSVKNQSVDYSHQFSDQIPTNIELVDPDRKFTYEHFPSSRTDSFLKLKRTTVSLLPIINEESSEACKEAKPRSILTNAGKWPQVIGNEEKGTKDHSEAASDIIRNCSYSPTVSPRQECIEILKNKLLSYFEKADPTASMPYDFVPQNQKFYMPCANISFVYQNARPSRASTRSRESGFDSLRTNTKVESFFGKRLWKEPTEDCFSKKFDFYQEYSENKYTPENKFNTEYFWTKIDPYAWRATKFSKAKYFVSGRDIIE